ncbi:hypothetical protein [Domibacillus robiginosus]|uniref:hypothetical protein n=1 Tax=Domibacillus robiginosus TaxID=1071054 RepID=UPI00067B71C7|nr:hypothetical protein [Domibacillus robiginosus]
MATKEQKNRKQFAEKLLRVKGLNYDEWLDSKHQEVIQDNQDVVMQALEMALGTNVDNSSDASADEDNASDNTDSQEIEISSSNSKGSDSFSKSSDSFAKVNN